MTSNNYQLVIGLEVHVQLLTKTKLFCGCSTAFGQPPNSSTCPVCLGLPGSLPVMNLKAFELAVRAALALNCEIATFTKWDRKNYFYPDLPKSYQISQYDLPFSQNGYLEIETENGPKKIGIIRAHLEEDAGKLLHDEQNPKGDSRVDLNRTGTPLVEIVSQPDLSSPEEARAYLEEIRLMMRELGVSDCEMQEGSLRCDANVNIHLPQENGSTVATPIVEVKNLNTIRGVVKALAYEGDRQFREFQAKGIKFGEAPKATAGWIEVKGKTVIQRRKEEASDYRYFPDPDLVPVVLEPSWIEQMRSHLGELPAQQRSRLIQDYGLSPYDSGVITQQGRSFVNWFEQVAGKSQDPKAASNWMTNAVLANLKEDNKELDELSIQPSDLAELITESKKMGLTTQRAREVFQEMLSTGRGAKQTIEQMGIKVLDDPEEIREMVKQAMAANTKAVADFKKGKTKAADAIKGAIMRETKGMAKMEVVQRIVLEEMEKS